MRNEEEMFELITGVAERDERIRVVILNGSRVNPNAPRDIFQDYDVVYVVTDVAPFKYNEDWIAQFGELMIMQMPEEMGDEPPSSAGSFTYLMQFADGNRIDLNLVSAANFDPEEDSLSVLLLDKDGIVGTLPEPSERDYLPKPPTPKAFDNCCNEFWWVSPYVAKGLWREEFVYAKEMLDRIVRKQLMKMLVWHIGVQTDFRSNPGKFGKHFEEYLEAELWEMLLDTYAGAGYDETWDALLSMGDLFRIVATGVAEHFSFDYPHGDDERVTAHLHHVRALPKDAQEMY